MLRQLGSVLILGAGCLLVLGSQNASAVGLPSGFSTLSGSHLILSGESAGDRLGLGVLGGGDFNGDGFDDIAVAAPGAGKIYVIYGGGGAFSGGGAFGVSTVADVTFTVEQTSASGEHYALAFTDFDNDGVDDLAIGLPYYGGSDTGRVYVIYGKEAEGAWAGTRSVAGASDSEVLTITHSTGGANFGWSLSGGRNANDSSGTIIEDLLVGSPGVSKSFLFYGKNGRSGSIEGTQSVSSFTGNSSTGSSFNGDAGDRLGESVYLGPKFTNPSDKRSSVVLGAPGAKSEGHGGSEIDDCGAVYGFDPSYGTNNSVGSAALSYRTACNNGPFNMGSSVLLADVDGAVGGYPDLLFGAPLVKFPAESEGEEPGRYFVRMGSSGGPDLTGPFAGPAGEPHLEGFDSEQVGQAMSVADIDGDGTRDVIFASANPGGWTGSPSWNASSGQVYVYLSSHLSDPGSTPYGLPNETGESPAIGSLNYAAAVLSGETSGEGAGAAVSGAGDLFNSGYEAFLVGAPSYDAGGTDRGRVYLFVPHNTTDQDGDGRTISSGDCNEGDVSVHAGADEICGDGIDQNCDGADTSCSDEDGDGDGFTEAQGDCNDNNVNIYPSAQEECNDIDDDCDDVADEDLKSVYYVDSDGDGYGNIGSDVLICDPSGAHVLVGGDCRDDDSDINPGATEVCDGIDNNCVDGKDEDLLNTYYADSDDDGYGNFADSLERCEQPNGYVVNSSDCDDADPDLNPNTVWYNDGDGDGYGDDGDIETQCTSPGNTFVLVDGDDFDCDDSDDEIHPGATELCDGEDNNCDGVIPANEADDDGDRFRVCENDCDDDDTTVNPSQPDVCDGKDNDCDDSIDENVETTFYADNDDDGFGDPDNTAAACSGNVPNGYTLDSRDCDDDNAATYMGAPEICDGEDNNCDAALPVDEQDVDNDDQLACADDCDDGDATVGSGFEEVCDNKDNNCNSVVDEGFDEDGDHYYQCPHGEFATDCFDNDATSYPGAPELCDGKDNDCDGTFEDEAIDGDGDGSPACLGGIQDDCDDNDALVNPDVEEEFCDGKDSDCDGIIPEDEYDLDGDLVVVCDGDCDDGDPTVFLDNPEVCDGKDNDCNEEIDEGVLAVYYLDGDSDGFGDPNDELWVCELPDGYVNNSLDCDDANATIYQGANEICDGEDNNCDGDLPANEVDEDGDFALICEGDCNDDDGTMFPGNTEICDGKDNDCNTVIDEGFDEDGIGGADCIDDDNDGQSEDEGDCDDTSSFVYLGADEIPDGIDNDCDTIIDEGLNDTDDDGDGYTESEGDCDDEDEGTFPNASDVCGDEIDNNCNDLIDEGCEEAGFFATCDSGQGTPANGADVLGFLALLLPALGLRRRSRGEIS